jgi:hypothetical protein
MDIKCTKKSCDYVDTGNTKEPLCLALAGGEDELASFSSKPTKSPTEATLEAEVTSGLSTLSLDSEGNIKFPRVETTTKACSKI